MPNPRPADITATVRRLATDRNRHADGSGIRTSSGPTPGCYDLHLPYEIARELGMSDPIGLGRAVDYLQYHLGNHHVPVLVAVTNVNYRNRGGASTTRRVTVRLAIPADSEARQFLYDADYDGVTVDEVIATAVKNPGQQAYTPDYAAWVVRHMPRGEFEHGLTGAPATPATR